ncbi:MAG TPA: hypothetical protein VK009_11590 [Chloroflexota bacterium]|nr:hypothetical protein [Chloroflexota bacterium]
MNSIPVEEMAEPTRIASEDQTPRRGWETADVHIFPFREGFGVLFGTWLE